LDHRLGFIAFQAVYQDARRARKTDKSSNQTTRWVRGPVEGLTRVLVTGVNTAAPTCCTGASTGGRVKFSWTKSALPALDDGRGGLSCGRGGPRSNRVSWRAGKICQREKWRNRASRITGMRDYSYSEAALLCGCHPDTVKRARARGRLPHSYRRQTTGGSATNAEWRVTYQDLLSSALLEEGPRRTLPATKATPGPSASEPVGGLENLRLTLAAAEATAAARAEQVETLTRLLEATLSRPGEPGGRTDSIVPDAGGARP
jgi:hypothetical protein